MFVDSSGLVAILAEEPDADDWRKSIAEAVAVSTSALVVLETVMRLSTKLHVEPEVAMAMLEELLEVGKVQIQPITAEHAALAVKAFARYRKGRGHPARLNLADCLSYACASAEGARLLYKGGDFALTDLA